MPPLRSRTSKPQGQAACLPCRRRKSRCKYEGGSRACLMCRAHETDCVADGGAQRVAAPAAAPRATTTSRQQQQQTVPRQLPSTPVAAPVPAPAPRDHPAHTTPLSAAPLDEASDENAHIVGPASAGDRHFLQDYLSGVHAGDGARVIRPVLPGMTSAPVVFTRVAKTPLGRSVGASPGGDTLQVVEKLVEPWGGRLVDLYFSKANGCFPILHDTLLHRERDDSRPPASPAVMACLYAHAIIYWGRDAELARHRRPDGRFLWNMALDALYSELHLSPGIPCIVAVLLNVGGRPTTTMLGNGMLLGCAISLAHCLGLNRNPVPWDIPDEEKGLRMQIWWCLLIHDRWSSFMYGTPPHIRQSHHDVPMPRGDDSNGIPGCTGERFRVFAALSSLTDVLGLYLEDLYTIRDRPAATLDLDAWRDSLPGDVRRIIVRGTDLRVPGSANLRLCFLAARFVSCRLQLADTDTTTTPGQQQQQQGLPGDRLQHVRQVAEDIVLFVHELGEEQLGDFWLPHAAFVLSSTATFLIRLAVQAAGAAQSLSLSLAKDLVASLRAHKQTHGWELGDICLDQYGHVVDNLDTSAQLPLGDGGGVGYWDPGVDGGMPNFLDSIIADQWDPMLWGEMA